MSIYVCVYDLITLLYHRNKHNIVNQLCLSKIIWFNNIDLQIL